MNFLGRFLMGVATVSMASWVVGCATADDGTDSTSDDVQSPQALSYVGNAVVAALEGKHPDMKGRAWNVSRDNAFKGDFVVQITPKSTWGQDAIVAAPRCKAGEESCEPDFGLYTCGSDADCGGGSRCATLQATVKHRGDQAQKLCIGDADPVLDEVWSGIALAKQTADVSSLSAPDGRFEAAVRNAITYASESDNPPRVRMLFGDYPGSFTSAKKILASVTRDVAADSTIQVNVADYTKDLSSWNHSKIISRDGNYAVMGGANMWDAHYLGKDPVHDIWIKLNGSSAGDAVRFLDELWAFACSGSQLDAWKDLAAREGSPSCPASFGAGPRVTPAGNKPVISVGRLGAAGDEPSDDALVAMIDAAKDTVRISQQDLGPFHKAGIPLGSWPQAILSALLRAMDRGVDVSITLSNTGAVPGDIGKLEATFNTYDNGWTPEEVAKEFGSFAQKHPETHPANADGIALVCEKLSLMRLRASDSETWKDGRTLANHAKVIVVDDRAFYAGSQNLYVANLAEFGTIVDDPAATKTFVDVYMSQVESYSKRTAVTGTHAPNGCVLAL